MKIVTNYDRSQELSLSFNVRVLNYNLTNIALPMRETTEHWNPVTQKTESSPARPIAMQTTQQHFDQSASDQVWHSVQTSSRSKKTKEWANVHLVTNTAGTDFKWDVVSLKHFFYFPFSNILKMNRWTCFMSLPTLVTQLGQLHSFPPGTFKHYTEWLG